MRETFQTSLPHLLRYADRDSMAHSVEVRLPYLDRRVAEFALSLPVDLIYRDGVTKWGLRQALRGTVPDLILDRDDKVGYEPPQARWLSSPRAMARLSAVLLDATAAGRYDTNALEQDLRAGAWRDHLAVWRAANVELWLRSSAAKPESL
jgi:asparagine synthase (glutamine-hydrolysing)